MTIALVHVALAFEATPFRAGRLAGAPMMEPPMDEKLAVASLGALAQAMRLRIFRALVGAGPEGLDAGRAARPRWMCRVDAVVHLKELMHAGLVSQQRDGRNLIYRPALARMEVLKVVGVFVLTLAVLL
ncbi:MAG: hypothetical protein MZW92_12220, partial [Comamonadaceae bacterium]|nr:hypothetical protein [Comamonadaceae bacterium]